MNDAGVKRAIQRPANRLPVEHHRACALRALCVLHLLCCAGCATVHFDGQHVRKPLVNYRVGVLDRSWQRLAVEHGDVAFQRPRDGVISVNATCKDYDDVPTSVLVNQLLFGTTERVFRVDEEVTLDGRGARHAVLDLELDGVPVRAEIYVLARNGCLFDLAYVSQRAAPAHETFTRFVHDFHVERAGRD